MIDQMSAYYDARAVEAAVARGDHRALVGGLWEEIGRLQYETLVARGLRPEHRLLDIGCGALRGGVHFVRYLAPGNYYGLDLNGSLLDAGYEQELGPLGLKERLPRENLLADGDFKFGRFGTNFDHAIALSLFTHLPLDLIRVCLERLAPCMKVGGVFYASFFNADEREPTYIDIVQEPAGVITHGGTDPFHHRISDFVHLCAGLPWDVQPIGDFGHPRGQKLIAFVRRETTASVDTRTRALSVAEASGLPPGADHYRAYVGPPERYDFIGASQFALLFQLGLRDNHKVLDFGCGSLRLGRMLIPFLAEGGYFGIDPNRWLIEDGIERELGSSAIALKKPHFAYNDDFDCFVFGQHFDFIVAQSIITHTGPDLLRPLLASAATALASGGLFIFSYIRESEAVSLPPNGWHYPGCVGYSEEQLDQLLTEAGLKGRGLTWFHPGATWHLAVPAGDALPSADDLARLSGSVLKSR